MRLIKTAIACRLGELDGLTSPMPASLCDEVKNEYPSFCAKKMTVLVNSDSFLDFIFQELGAGNESLIQIFNIFVLEDDSYCRKYREIF